MSRVFVTGGIGLVGRAAVAHLLEKGYQVRILDRKSEAEARAADRAAMYAQAEYVQGDINNYPDLLDKVRGCDLIMHLAAIPAPQVASPDEVFRVNAAGTFNVFRAAEELGIQRVSQASSINALGLYYGVKPAEPFYLPVDEDHPPQSSDAYSFSKWVVEEIADYYWRRAGISSVSLRFPGVLPASAMQWRKNLTNRSSIVEHALAMSEAERAEWLNTVLEQIRQLRAEKKMEDMVFQRKIWSPESPLNEDQRFILMMRNNLWALVDDRDAAQALEKGLSAEYEGAHPLFINDDVNVTGGESETLARLFFPDVTERKHPLVGSESLVSIERARKLIGFAPQYTMAA